MKKYLSLLIWGMIAFILTGCSGNYEVKNPSLKVKTATDEPSEVKLGGSITVGVYELTGDFNPAYCTTDADEKVVDLVFDSLITLNENGVYEPSACTSWEYSDDSKEIIFKIRQDITFGDGVKVTADDVVFTYKLLADPSYQGKGENYVKALAGIEEYKRGYSNTFMGVTKISDDTVKFSFKEALRTNLSYCDFYIMPEHYYGANWKNGDTSTIKAITDKPIGSGPYTLEDFKVGENAILRRRRDYYGKGYYIEKLLFEVVDRGADIERLKTGDIDVLPKVTEVEKLNAINKNEELTFNKYNRAGYGYVKFNCQYGPTSEIRVRQALYYAFNVQDFVNNYFRDTETGEVLGSVQYHPFSPISWALDDKAISQLIEYKYDLNKAATILDEEGWKVGPSGFREKAGKIMELKICALTDSDILNSLIPMWQSAWGEGLKIKLNIAYLPFDTILNYVLVNSDENVENWNLYFLATDIISADPHSLYTMFHSAYVGNGKDNDSRYKNFEVDKLFEEAKSITDIEQAKPYYRRILKILNEEAVTIPVYVNNYFDLYNKKLKNFSSRDGYGWAKALRNAYVQE